MSTQASLPDLVGQKPILVTLASYLSTVDLLHLGLSVRRCHALILGSPEVFDVLKRQCLCDGEGLRQRLADSFSGTQRHKVPEVTGHCGFRDDNPETTIFWEALERRTITNPGYMPRLGGWVEAEIEVRLYARRCDAANALPFLRCGINVYEECRDYPRVLPDLGQWPDNSRPHLQIQGGYENVMALCPPCDDAMEQRLQCQFLNARCDCDRYSRWICRKCTDAEARDGAGYVRDHTSEWSVDSASEGSPERKSIRFDNWLLWLDCTCGSIVLSETLLRCTWCKRRHRPESEWGRERWEVRANIPLHADDGGCYPMYSTDRYSTDTYPRLNYQGPIHRNADRATGADGQDREEIRRTLPLPKPRVE